MNKLYFPVFKGLAVALLLFSSLYSQAIAPKWSDGYPQIINGATSIDLTFNLDQNGTVYYVVYSSIPANVSPSTIKTDAKSTLGGNILKNGLIPVNSLLDTKGYVTGLKDGGSYYIYSIAENSTGDLQTAGDIKSFSISLPVRQSVNSYKTSLISNGIIGYLAYFPEAYYKNPTADYPVLLFLHGAGEKTNSTDNTDMIDLVKAHGPPMLIDQGQDFPFIVISPQCPWASWDYAGDVEKDGAFVDEIVEMMKSKYRIDNNRMYITGLSMGGAGTFSYIQNVPGKMAAAIPIAGWGDPSRACTMKDIGLWVFQGEYDGGESIQGLVDAVNYCKTPTAEQAKATVYAGVGHDAWSETYDNSGPGIAPDNIYDWLLRHSLNNSVNQPPVSNAGTDINLTLPLSSISLNGSGKDSDGTIVSYSWTQVSGPTLAITGANSSTASLSSLIAGSFVFRLTVTDNGGGTSSDDINITINAAPIINKVPVANAGPDKSIILPINTIGLQGTASDSDGTVASYVWTEISGPTTIITGANTSLLSLSSLIQGTYTFRLTVTDNQGASSSDDVLLTVAPPLATLGASVPSLGFASLSLCDADKSIELCNFSDGFTLDLSAYPNVKNFTVLVKSPSSDVESILFNLDGGVYRIEDDAPFAMTGNCYPGYNCYGAYWSPSVGSHSMAATAYSSDHAAGTKGTSITVSFTVINSGAVVAASAVPSGSLLLTQLVLADADKSTEIQSLPDGSTINLSSLGIKDYTVLAKTGSTDIGSVVFHLDGGLFRIEDYAPFSLTGNCYPGYNCYGAYWQPGVGEHTVTATAYSLAGGNGTKGTSITTKFSVVSSSSRLSADDATASLQASPNPFTEQLTVSLGSSKDESLYNVSLIDAQGSTVFQNAYSAAGQFQLELSGMSLKSGLYVLQVTSLDGHKKSVKVIKQ